MEVKEEPIPILNEWSVWRWFAKFESGDLRHAIEDDLTKSSKKLSSELGLSQSSVNSHIYYIK